MILLALIVVFFGPPVYFLSTMQLANAVVLSMIYAISVSWLLQRARR